MTLLKFLVFNFFIVLFLAHSFIGGLLIIDSWEKRRWRAHLASDYAKIGAWLLGLNVMTRNEEPRGQGFLMVGNHLSYLDLLIIASQRPVTFVTSREIRELPVLGWITQLAGCLYVERRNKSNLPNEVKEIREALELGLDVVVFPEATSTNGESVLRFRRPLFAAARLSSREVAPFCINYREIDGSRIDRSNRDRICWYGDMGFVSHLFGVCQARSIQVGLDWLETLRTQYMDEEQLANASHFQVSYNYSAF